MSGEIIKIKNLKLKSKSNKPRVVVAMSGGVDSSVAAYLLKKQGFEVIGLFLKFWQPKTPSNGQKAVNELENKCCSTEAAEQARKVAQKLNIPFYVLDFRASFKKEVVDYFISEYKKGRTPNPCVKCNQLIKFGKLLEKTKELGADFLATGHYVRLRQKSEIRSTKFETNSKSKIPNPKFFHLLQAKDKNKDQSYFLWTLTQGQLKRLIFPIGDYSKPEVRKMAQKWGLPTASRKESQEICFVFDTVSEFLKNYIKSKRGEILDSAGKIVGQHEGAIFYTIGQRQNLNIKASVSNQKPYYVVNTDIKKNIVVVGYEKDLYSDELIAEDVNFLSSKFSRLNVGIPISYCGRKEKSGKAPAKGDPLRREARARQRRQISNEIQKSNNKMNIQARIRYGHPAIGCRVVKGLGNRLKVKFDKPVRAITPGQSIVFYQKDEVLGGGIIS